MDIQRFLSELSRSPNSWRLLAGCVLTTLAMLAVLFFERGRIAVLYMFLIVLAGGILTVVWEYRARTRKANCRSGKAF